MPADLNRSTDTAAVALAHLLIERVQRFGHDTPLLDALYVWLKHEDPDWMS